jgi:hypothetical protein
MKMMMLLLWLLLLLRGHYYYWRGCGFFLFGWWASWVPPAPADVELKVEEGQDIGDAQNARELEQPNGRSAW